MTSQRSRTEGCGKQTSAGDVEFEQFELETTEDGAGLWTAVEAMTDGWAITDGAALFVEEATTTDGGADEATSDGGSDGAALFTADEAIAVADDETTTGGGVELADDEDVLVPVSDE